MNELVYDEVDDFLEHFGKKGMHWGVRNGDHPEVSRKVNRQAKKDATEHARAKMFYGDGAGTRRKLIKAKVEAKSKQNPDYKKAFDHHLANQDLGRHADKAKGERRRKDVQATTGKAARSINRHINGPFAGGIAAVTAVAAYGYVHSKGYDAYAAQVGKNFIENLLR
jgi:hypothetical protein